MGGGMWSDDLYEDRAAYRSSTGASTFAYDADVKSGKAAAKAHADLDPKGVKVRESRDSANHPNSMAIGVVFDVTGSMGQVPRVLQTKLCKLMNLLIDKDYCKDPQILSGAVGDYYSDKVPFQAGQFESDIKIDEQLSSVYIEGGGGGQNTESYQLALYFFARKISMDCWEKRGKKGYLFLMGDEHPYMTMNAKEIKTVFGDTVEGPINTIDLVREVQQRFHLFFIIPGGTSYYDDPNLKAKWQSLVGPENVIMLPDPNLVCEVIGSTIGVIERSLSADDIVSDLGGGKDAMVVRSAVGGIARAPGSAEGIVPTSGSGATRSTRL